MQKVFEHRCVATVCENNQPVIHPLIFYNPQNKPFQISP